MLYCHRGAVSPHCDHISRRLGLVEFFSECFSILVSTLLKSRFLVDIIGIFCQPFPIASFVVEAEGAEGCVP